MHLFAIHAFKKKGGDCNKITIESINEMVNLGENYSILMIGMSIVCAILGFAATCLLLKMIHAAKNKDDYTRDGYPFYFALILLMIAALSPIIFNYFTEKKLNENNQFFESII